MAEDDKIEPGSKEEPPKQSSDGDLAGTDDGSAESIGSKTKQGVLWTAVFNGIQTFIGLASNIAIVRILEVAEFGLAALANIVLQFARRIANFGFTMVLVQRKEIKREHIDTVFVTNFLLLGSTTALVFFGAPYIASFFEKSDQEMLRKILMLISFDFILKAIGGIPLAILRREMKFRELEIAKTAAGLTTAIVPVILALLGFGVWSLIIGYLSGTVVSIFVSSAYARWLPRFRFHYWALKDVFSFGLWVYIDSYISFAINKTDFTVISKLLGDTALGFYERAFNLMSLPRKQIADRVNSILFSAYSRLQDDAQKVTDAFLRVVTYFSIILFPLMTWLYFTAPAFIINVYGEKWAMAVLPFQILCFAGITDTLTQIVLRVVLARGLVQQRARRRFAYLVLLIGACLFGVQWGIEGVAWGVIAASIIQLFMLLHLAVSDLPLTYSAFIKAQKSAIIYAVVQAGMLIGVVYLGAQYVPIDSWVMLFVTTIVSLIALAAAHAIFRFADLNDIFKELSKEIRKFARKLPLISRLLK